MAVRHSAPRRIAWCAAALTAVLTASGCAQSIAGRPVAGSPALSPAAYVIQSTKNTLGQKTAALTLSGTITAAGQSIPLHGQGKADLTKNSIDMTMSMNIAGHAFTMRELFVKSKLYMSISVEGHSLKEETGFDWVALPIPTSGSASLTGGNPLGALSTLEQQGATVKSLGTSTINGLQVDGYEVTPSHAAMLKQAQKSLPTLGLSPSQQQAALHAIETSPVPIQKVWLDSKQHLLRRVTTDLNLNVGGSTAGGQIEMDFVQYGVPVSVHAPDPSDVESYKQFLSGTH